MGKRSMLLAAGLVALASLGGCGDTDGDDDDTGAGTDTDVSLVEGVTEEISSIDNTFRPEAAEVAAGTEVVWENDGRNEHNVLPVEGDDWGVEADDFAPGDSYSYRFTEPGTYDYYCTLHGTTTAGMVGSITVTG